MQYCHCPFLQKIPQYKKITCLVLDKSCPISVFLERLSPRATTASPIILILKALSEILEPPPMSEVPEHPAAVEMAKDTIFYYTKFNANYILFLEYSFKYLNSYFDIFAIIKTNTCKPIMLTNLTSSQGLLN